MKYAVIIAAIVMLISLQSSPSHAEDSKIIDMRTYTCKDLQDEQQEDFGLLLMWAEGYISCATDDLTLDEAWITELSQTIIKSCDGHPEVRIFDIIQRVINE